MPLHAPSAEKRDEEREEEKEKRGMRRGRRGGEERGKRGRWGGGEYLQYRHSIVWDRCIQKGLSLFRLLHLSFQVPVLSFKFIYLLRFDICCIFLL